MMTSCLFITFPILLVLCTCDLLKNIIKLAVEMMLLTHEHTKFHQSYHNVNSNNCVLNCFEVKIVLTLLNCRISPSCDLLASTVVVHTI